MSDWSKEIVSVRGISQDNIWLFQSEIKALNELF